MSQCARYQATQPLLTIHWFDSSAVFRLPTSITKNLRPKSKIKNDHSLEKQATYHPAKNREFPTPFVAGIWIQRNFSKSQLCIEIPSHGEQKLQHFRAKNGVKILENFSQFSPITKYRGKFGKFHNILAYNINFVCLFKIWLYACRLRHNIYY